jgi:hypothetical protein
MVDIDLLLRDYGRQLDERCPPTTSREIQNRLGLTDTVNPHDDTDHGEAPAFFDHPDSARPTMPTERRSFGVAIAVAATILLMAGILLVGDDRDAIVSSPDSSVVETGPTTSGVMPNPTSPPEASIMASPLPWSPVPHDEEIFGGWSDQWMSSVTAGGPGLVAVGSIGSRFPGGSFAAAVWTSVDGLTWSRVPHDANIFSGTMSSVIAGGPGLVAVGWAGQLNSVGGEPAAAVWTSVDGFTWTRVPNDEGAFGSAHDDARPWMKSVTVGGPGLVAVGLDGSDAAVWTSVDGLTWSRVPHDDDVFGGNDEEWQGMNSVTVGGPGLVAVGGGEDARVWTSVDGLTWSRVPHDVEVFGGDRAQGMHSVTAGGPGLVAVGFDSPHLWFPGIGPLNAYAAVWTSVDGITWSRVPHSESVFGGEGDQWMHSVTVGGPGLVAVGGPSWTSGSGWSHEEAGQVIPADAVVWTSADGLIWTRLPSDPAIVGEESYQWMQSVTAGGPGLIAVGSQRSNSPLNTRGFEVDAAVWVTTGEE